VKQGVTAVNWNPDYLDQQYNNRLRVPDFVERHMQPWQAASAQVRAQQACLLGVPYASGGAAQTLDIFPAGGSKQPVLVFIHGGYWRSLDKSDFSFVAPAFTQQGACVVVPNYGLCPAVTIEQIVLQQVQALAWVYRNIAKYGGDPSRITVIGHSAGGHLAAMLLACQWQQVGKDLPANLLRKAISVSGLHDLEPIMHAPYLQTDLRLTPAQVRRCSPAYFPAPQGTLYALCGGDESDEFLRQNRLIEQAWESTCVPVREALLGLNHFSILDALTTSGTRAHTLAQQLLQQP
jgi:arylformamidase